MDQFQWPETNSFTIEANILPFDGIGFENSLNSTLCKSIIVEILSKLRIYLPKHFCHKNTTFIHWKWDCPRLEGECKEASRAVVIAVHVNVTVVTYKITVVDLDPSFALNVRMSILDHFTTGDGPPGSLVCIAIYILER